MNVTRQQINEAKNVPITAILAQNGIQPLSLSGGEYNYLSPFRNEKDGSFYVNEKKNVFRDFGDTENSGDVIRLVQTLLKKDFVSSVVYLLEFSGNTAVQLTAATVTATTPQKAKNRNEILKVTPVNNKYLLDYAKSRGIREGTVIKYLSQVYYENAKGKFYSLGFLNDSGGYELRNEKFKGFVGGNKTITTIRDNAPSQSNRRSQHLVLFEGFFDFLSYVELKSGLNPYLNYIVLNSTSLINQVDHKKYHIIDCHFDNDEAGIRAFEKLRDSRKGLITRNISAKYAPAKDLNDYLTELKQWQERKPFDNNWNFS